MRRSLSLLLALILALCVLPGAGFSAFAAKEPPPIPAPENLVWNGALAAWDKISLPDDAYSQMYYYSVELYRLFDDGSRNPVYDASYISKPTFDFGSIILRNGYGRYCFTVRIHAFGPGVVSEPTTSPAALFTAENMPPVPLPAPHIVTSQTDSYGRQVARWQIDTDALPDDAQYVTELTLYKNGEAVKTVTVEQGTTEYTFSLEDIPPDSEAEFYFGYRLLPAAGETRFTASEEASGKYSSIVPAELMPRTLTETEALPARAGDEQLIFHTAWSGAYGRVTRMYACLRITSADSTVTERSAYWTMQYVQGSRTQFTYTKKVLDYTFRENDLVEWELYLEDIYLGTEYSNVSGSFTVEKSVPHTVTLDVHGKGENTTVTVPDRSRLSSVENVAQQYPVTEGYRILGWSKEKKASEAYTGSDAFTGEIYGDTTLYAILKPTVSEAEIHVTAPVCGTEVSVTMLPGIAWYCIPSNTAEVTVPADAPYKLRSQTQYWYQDAAAEEEGDVFSGVIKGGETYVTGFYLEMKDDGESNSPVVFAPADQMTLSGTFTSAEALSSYSGFYYSELLCRITVTAVHEWGEWEISVAPAAGKPGEEKRCCKHCEAYETRALAPSDHKLTLVPAVPATCTADGNIAYYTCADCDKLFADSLGKTEIKPADTVVRASGHSWGAWTKADAAKHRRVCANDPSHIETADHSWDKGTVTTPATCKDEGVKTYTCTVCNATKTEAVPKLTEHTWNAGAVTTPATCKDEGVKAYTCTVCKATKTEAVPKLTEHTWDAGTVTTPATCKNEGVKTYTCTVCKATKTEAVPKLTEHTWDAGTVTTPATCKDEGVKTYTCAVCNLAKTEALPKLTEHTWDNGTVTKEATETEEGEKTFTCTVCGSKKTEPIEKQPVSVLLGDVNLDGRITAADARLALRRAVGLETYPEGSRQFIACDVDKNQKVTAADARKILRAAVGLDDPKKW